MLRPASARLRGLRRALWPGRGTPRRGCRAAAAAAEPQPPSAPPAEPLWWTLAGRILHRPAFQKRSEFGFAQALRSAPAEELFRGQSEAGNGLVTLTRHGAFTSLRFGTSDQVWPPARPSGRTTPSLLALASTSHVAFLPLSLALVVTSHHLLSRPRAHTVPPSLASRLLLSRPGSVLHRHAVRP